MRVLFVDDEVRVLEALERVLFELEADWQTAFANSADLAFAELGTHSYDVVVSDLRMSGTDGIALLTRIRELYPATVRIVLSGHSDEEMALQMVPVAHQFLAKPCAAETLHRIILRTEHLRGLLTDRRLQGIVGRVGCLPSAADVQAELMSLLDQPGVTAADVAAVIKRDPGMTAKLLQVASSAFFNTSASVADVETAIMRLGFRTLRTFMQPFGALESTAPGHETRLTIEALQRRSLNIAQVAAGMAKLPEDASVAYTAGLLCDVGQLVLASAAPERIYLTHAAAGRAGTPQHVAESAAWGATHAEVGALLLGLWGLPFQIVEAVATHHAPERQSGERCGLPQLVWLAACIVEGEEPAPEALHRFGVEELYQSNRLTFEGASS